MTPIEALKAIANPIKHLKDNLKEGEKLDGMMAVALSKDANWLSSIASEALASYNEGNMTRDEWNDIANGRD